MPTDAERRDLFTALEHTLGPAPAATLMELLPPVGWADVATRADVAAHATALRGEMAELRGEMAALRAELQGEVAELRGEMAELRAELRAGLGALEARIDGLVARQIAASVPVMFGTAGLVLAAAKLA